MFARIEREEKEHGYVDYITVSASLLFAMKYVTSLEGMKKEAIYNRIRQTDYPEVTKMFRVWCSWLIRRTSPPRWVLTRCSGVWLTIWMY